MRTKLARFPVTRPRDAAGITGGDRFCHGHPGEKRGQSIIDRSAICDPLCVGRKIRVGMEIRPIKYPEAQTFPLVVVLNCDDN